MFPESLTSEKYTTVHTFMLHFHQKSPCATVAPLMTSAASQKHRSLHC